MIKTIRLGVNIDHVATLRQARGTRYPDPIYAALLAEEAGADSITLHLREDRRHIQDHDLARLKEVLQIPINLEMAVTDEMVAIAKDYRPTYCALVPEKRAELTTEGGLDVVNQAKKIANVCAELTKNGIEVSLFIDPDRGQIDAAREVGARVIEINTGAYAEAKTLREQQQTLAIIIEAANYADQVRLRINAGHGLHYHNVTSIAVIPVIHELNIGHAIVARAVFTGFKQAVIDMQQLMMQARYGSNYQIS